jgi:alpha-L-arabinofuranosidase
MSSNSIVETRSVTPRKHHFYLVHAVLLSCLSASAAAFVLPFTDPDTAACAKATNIRPGKENTVTSTSTVIKALTPQFFGFNLEWVGFQDDLWDDERGVVKSEVISALTAFPGAVYRYPGGTVANHYEVRAGLGPLAKRPSRKAVDWKPPLVNKFGYGEYSRFLAAVQGTPWVVANLYGNSGGEQDDAFVRNQATHWLDAMGKTGPRPYRWELGNELDRSGYHWSPDKYAHRAKLFAETLSASADATPFLVAPLEDYDARKDMPARTYNAKVASSLGGLTSEYAHHLYYDGPPGGPPIPHRLRQICQSRSAIKAATGAEPAFWITEHARWPEGKINSPQWKDNWHQTQNLEAALSVSDMVIALSQMPTVKGAFLHSLAGTYGPWPLFHKVGEELSPSAVYWAMRILRESMQDEVLGTTTMSTRRTSYSGGYDIRASVMANRDRTTHVIWAVNRSAESATTKFALDGIAPGKLEIRHAYLSDANPKANNRADGNRIKPAMATNLIITDDTGVFRLTLPPYSVNTFTIQRAGK